MSTPAITPTPILGTIGGIQIELKKDYSAEVKLAITESIEIANKSGLDEAFVLLLALEKKCRLGNDVTSLKEICLHIVRLAREKQDWDRLNSIISTLNKRRAQSKAAVSAIVQEAMEYLNQTPNLEKKIELIKTLKDICEGKIYLEADSAKLHLMLALILEEGGDIAAACDTIQDVHVETYGSLTKKEKAEYILQQIRLNLLRKDFVRTIIQSRKMNRKVIEDDGFEEIKISFYTMMIDYHKSYEKDTWEICQSYYKIYDTSVTRANPEALKSSLQSCIIYLLLSKYGPEQSDMMHRLKGRADLNDESLALYQQALIYFTTPEVITWPFHDAKGNYQDFEMHPSLHSHGAEAAEHFLKLFRTRIIEHNIRTVVSYYTRIRISSLGKILSLSQDVLEEHLSDLAGTGDITCKINRPEGIVSFKKNLAPEAILSDWASDIGKMLNLMESTCHLINRENMIYKV